jgi:hypothetical protein
MSWFWGPEENFGVVRITTTSGQHIETGTLAEAKAVEVMREIRSAIERGDAFYYGPNLVVRCDQVATVHAVRLSPI